MMSDVARSLQITLVGGSISERSGNSLYNTCCVFGSDGKLKGKHRKVCSDSYFCDSLRPILLIASIYASRHILVLDTSVFAISNMGRRTN
jgi:hypothetical protein